MIESRFKKAKSASVPKDVARRFVEAARKDNLVDVAYTQHDSPFGTCVVASTQRGLVRLAFTDEVDEVLDDLARRVSPRVLEMPSRLDGVRRELDEYFAGTRREFDVPLDWSLVHGFNLKVLRATARIPFGNVSTYKDMARKAGSPRAARAAGNALHNNPLPVIVPCHRVLHADGGLGGYGGGLPMKESLLKLEGALE